MATNTGYKQAVVAYSIDEISGAPLDVDGQITSVSGKRQAIALLEGMANPDPSKYEVLLTFTAGGNLAGVPTTARDLEDCPEGQPVPWILTTGFWDNSARWINNETWNY